jgi:hypothetical protein
MKQVNAVKAWLAKNAKANVDIIVSGNPVRIQKLGKVIADMKVPARVIGCNVKNSDVFKYTHQDEHPCVWAINHSDVVITIGDGMVVTKAKEYAFKTSRSCYNYGRQFVESICKGHYEKAVITRADIVTTNEAKAIKAEESKVVAEPKVDLVAVAKAELDAAKKAYEAAKAKYDKLVAEFKPAVEEKPGHGYKSIAQEIEEELAAPVDTTGDVISFRDKTYEVIVDDFEPMDAEEMEEAIKNGDVRRISKNHNDMAKMVSEIGDATKPVEMRLELAEPVDGQTEAIVRLDENGLFVAEPVKADFTFEGKGYNVVVKEAFDVELFNSCDAETQKMVVEESMAAGHIVAA